MENIIKTLLGTVMVLTCIASGCTPASTSGFVSKQAQANPPAQGSFGRRDTHGRLDSVLWVQTSVEYQILCQMVFEDARNALDQALQDPSWSAALEQSGNFQSLPPAIVLDIDDTVLDNSLFYGHLVADRSGYDFNLWKEWVERSEAPPLPGAADFVFYAASKGVEIFYITNRDANMEAATRRNLSRLGVNLPMGQDTVLMNGEKPGWTSDKSTRRAAIAEYYRILLLVGDDLGDFVPGAKDTPENRLTLAAKYRAQWGRRWFLLPNPLSGTWELALYGNDPGMTDTEILEKKLRAVKYFGEPAAQTATPVNSGSVPDVTVTFRGDKCTYGGPDKVYAGRLTVGLSVIEKKFTSYGLFMAILDPDKTMQDLKNWPSLDQPPWVHTVDAKTVTPGYPTSLSVLVTEGPLYLICFGFDPETIIGQLGPIEVVK